MDFTKPKLRRIDNYHTAACGRFFTNPVRRKFYDSEGAYGAVDALVHRQRSPSSDFGGECAPSLNVREAFQMLIQTGIRRDSEDT